jgi:SAM-dependent methyltransferase
VGVVALHEEKAMDWGNGYVVDSEYAAGFFAQQAPGHLGIVCALNGIEPPAPDQPFSYCELGAGQCLTAAVLAAGHPHGSFYAVDFLPAHIAGAQALARESGLDNLILLEQSFEALAAGSVELPMFDYITLHGVYSWVSPENRRHIVDFISRYLKPGGIVYVSYNALPGWSVAGPLQRLVLEHAAANPAGSAAQVGAARAFVQRLVEVGAGYFTLNQTPVLADRLEVWRHERTGYLAHEYLNQCWEPLYHADLARAFAAGKLDYVCQAQPIWGFLRNELPEAQRQLLEGITDPTLRETVADYLLNTCFRSDVFVRGARRMSPGRRREWLSRIGLALTVSRRSVALGGAAGAAEDGLGEHRAVLDALADGPLPLTELIALPNETEHSVSLTAAKLMANHEGALYWLRSDEQVDAAPALRLNRAIATAARVDDRYHALASPLTGSALRAGRLQRLAYLWLLQHDAAEIDADAITREIRAALVEPGQPLVLDGRSIEGEDAQLQDIAETVALILERSVPTWRQHGLLPKRAFGRLGARA